MKQLLKRRPSPALIVSALALMVAMGGTAVALPGKDVLDKNDIGKTDVRKGDIAKGVVTSTAIKNGEVGVADVAEAARSPRSYALVTADNQVDEAHSRGITDAMVDLQTDVYCLYDLPGDPKHVQVTLDRVGINGDIIAQATLSDTAGCSGAEDASVRMFDVSAADNQIAPDFYISIFE